MTPAANFRVTETRKPVDRERLAHVTSRGVDPHAPTCYNSPTTTTTLKGFDMNIKDIEFLMGDLLVSRTGREYVVVKHVNGDVYYAYVPANSQTNKIKIEHYPVHALQWVESVLRDDVDLLAPQVRIGSVVSYGGYEFVVTGMGSGSYPGLSVRSVGRIAEENVVFVR